ncbi:MAG: hypothetical protein EI684_02130 [Candidatus Viridilinea halotolerans]|uniref:Uncharacterized protein n=1 Tax=Candidatus Viridilinea halotolerans TaxID=2491704 RepID=A0A426U990_9CHLR|nr:MAG: hypothetical protein EI684_02130 [Candidatus Viridilinea halotolerans]
MPAWLAEGSSSVARQQTQQPAAPEIAPKTPPLVLPSPAPKATTPVTPVAKPVTPAPPRTAPAAPAPQGSAAGTQPAAVQRAATNRPLQDQMARPPAAAPDPPPPPSPPPDLDALARQVYNRLKQRLAAELRRKG